MLLVCASETGRVETSEIEFISPSKNKPLGGLEVQTNFKEFIENCHTSLILPEDALNAARQALRQNV